MDVSDSASIGSVISLRSVSEAPEPIQRKTRPGSGIRNSKNSPYGTQPRKKTPGKKSGREMLVTALQNGSGLSSEGHVTNTWKHGRPPNLSNKTTATEFLLEQLTANSGMSNGSQRTSASTARAGGKGPVYKDPESYYDEIQSLKRTLKGIRTEHALLKAKNGRLTDEVNSKSKKIEELLSPDTQNNDLRRTITSKNTNSSEVVMSLKRRIYRLEENLRSKENETRKMKSELKVTNMEEMKYENMLCYTEIIRLGKLVGELKDRDHNMISDQAIQDAMRGDNTNKAQLLLKRLTDDNRNLVLENKSLKNDLMKLTTQTDETNINLEKDYEDMNRNELLQKISALELKLKEEESRDPKHEKEDLTVDQKKLSDGKKDEADIIGDRCIELKGPPPQQVKQLRARERELLEDVERLEGTVKKLKEDRSHYRKMTDDYRKQLDQMVTSSTPASSHKKKETGNESDTGSLKSERSTALQRKASTSSRKDSETPRKEMRSSQHSHSSGEQDKKISISRQNEEEEKGKRNKKKDDSEDEFENAIISIQSAWRGHNTRQGYLDTVPSRAKYDKKYDLDDEDVLLIQSAYRGHATRRKMLKKMERERNGKNSGYGKFQSKQEQTYVTDDDDDDDDDDDVVIGSSASFSRYREQNDNDWKRQQKSSSSSKRMSTSRDPTIYRDPEKQGRGEWYQNKNKSRDNNRASMSQYLEENEREDAERRRKVDEVRRNSRPHQQESSLSKLKSNSSPWRQSSTNQIEDSEDDDDVIGGLGTTPRQQTKHRNKTTGQKKQDRTSSNKWAQSDERKSKNEEDVRRKVQLRQTKELLTSFQDGDGSSDDDDDLIMSPSIKRDTKKMSKKAMMLDDELF